MTVDTQPRAMRWRPTGLFLAAVAVYFTLQFGLRLILGGALETDEAEMMVMTPGFQAGYGPQLPLYNWLQVALFKLFGAGLPALAVLKNLLIGLTYVLVFVGLRLWVPARQAALASLSLFLIPDIAWEAQRATTHSNMLLATSAGTLAAFLWVMKTPRLAAYLVLGLAIGLGALSKYNYWAVPLGLIASALSMPAFRARILSPRLGLSAAVAVAVFAGPYLWMFANADLAFSSAAKLGRDPDGALARGVRGLGDLVAGYAILLILPVLVAAALFVLRDRSRPGLSGNGALVVRLLGGAAFSLLAISPVAVVLGGVGHITPRWLLPVVFLAVPAVFLALSARLGRGAVRGFLGGLAVLAVLILAGLGYDRFKPGARKAVDFAPLVTLVDAFVPMPDTPVVAEFYTAGNLQRLRPDWQISPYLGLARQRYDGQTVLFLQREKTPRSLAAGLRQAGWDEGGELLSQGAMTLPFAGSDDTLPIRYYLVRTSPAAASGQDP